MSAVLWNYLIIAVCLNVQGRSGYQNHCDSIEDIGYQAFYSKSGRKAG